MAGGGSLLTLPALILLGLPPTAANGTNRVGVLLQSLVAARRFEQKGLLRLADARPLILPTALGAAIGAWVSLDIDEALFKRIIGLVMIAMALIMAARPKRWLEGRPEAQPGPRSPLVFFAIGLYGGFLQAGVGIFLLAGLVLSQGQDLLRANALKSLLVAGFTIPPLLLFTWHGAVAWIPAIVLAVGSMAGAEIGARLSIAGGAQGIRFAVIAVIAVSGTKLLGLW